MRNFPEVRRTLEAVDKRLFLLQTPFKTQRQSREAIVQTEERDAESPYSPGNIRLRITNIIQSESLFSRLMNIMESYKLDVFKM